MTVSHHISADYFQPPVDPFWRRWHFKLLPLVHRFEENLAIFQRKLGVTSEKRVIEKLICDGNTCKMVVEEVPETFTSHPHSSNKYVHTLFAVASELGNEPFYALWATSTAIFLDPSTSLPLLVLWALGMYLGQFLKDNLRLPRPGLYPISMSMLPKNAQQGKDISQSSPSSTISSSSSSTSTSTSISPCHADLSVIRLETKYAAEFGFPSTHALGAFSLPLLTLLLLHSQYTLQSTTVCILWVSLQLFWMLTTPISRLYRGVHSFLDIVGGSCLGIVLSVVTYLYSTTIVTFLSNWIGCSMFMIMCIILLVLYPRTTRWSNSLGDTALILGTTCGAAWGIALSQLLSPRQPFLQIALPNTTIGFFIAILRLILTVVVMYGIRLLNRPNVYRLTRTLLKRLATPAKMAAGADVTVAHMGTVGKWVHDLPVSEMYIVESVEKFIGFFGMGIMATLFFPPIFEAVGLNYDMSLGS